MKLVKNFVFAVLLVSTLAFNTFAGDIDIPGNKPGSQPPPVGVAYDDSLPPVSGTDTQQPGVDTSDYFIYEALAALLSLY